MNIKLSIFGKEMLSCAVLTSFMVCVSVGIPFGISKLFAFDFLKVFCAFTLIAQMAYVVISSCTTLIRQFKLVNKINAMVRDDIPITFVDDKLKQKTAN